VATVVESGVISQQPLAVEVEKVVVAAAAAYPVVAAECRKAAHLAVAAECR